MAPLRFICFVFVLVLVHLRDATAQTHQDMKKSVLQTARSSSTHVEKGVGLAVHGGRRRILKKGLKKEEVLNRQETRSVGSRNGKRKGILNVEGKLESRSSQLLDHGKFNMGGSTAFSADYHVPQSHPPRNN